MPEIDIKLPDASSVSKFVTVLSASKIKFDDYLPTFVDKDLDEEDELEIDDD